MAGLQIFNYQDAQVRTILKDGEPWFVAKDVAEVLGYSNTNDAIIRHCKGVVKHDAPSLGGMQSYSIIPERDVYRLIMRSKLPSAERFEEWVVGEVLPAIRKTGNYSLQLPKTYSEALRMLADSVEREEANKPKVEAFDTFLGTKNSQTMNQVAKALDIGRNTLFSILRDRLILMKSNLPFQRYITTGYFTVREVMIKQGEEAKSQTLVTAKGVEFIRQVLKSDTAVA